MSAVRGLVLRLGYSSTRRLWLINPRTFSFIEIALGHEVRNINTGNDLDVQLLYLWTLTVYDIHKSQHYKLQNNESLKAPHTHESHS